MKRLLLIILVLVLAFVCLGCQYEKNENNSAKEKNQYTLDVSFTAIVDEVLDDPNAGEDVPRYAVVRPFQDTPVLVDVGIELAKNLEEGVMYTFVMEQKQNIAMIEGKAHNLNTIIPLYDLKVKSIEKPLEGQIGLDSVNIGYSRVSE